MTATEYVQLKAFARIDGFRLSLLWAVSFACYIAGLNSPGWTLAAAGMSLFSLLFVARCLKSFRDVAREGIISFMRGWAFVILVFFYAGILFALLQYVYFTYLDQGYLLRMLQQMTATPEAQQMISQYGMGDTINENLRLLQTMRPIDMSLNLLSTNIMLGIVLGAPIAAFVKSDTAKANKEHQS